MSNLLIVGLDSNVTRYSIAAGRREEVYLYWYDTVSIARQALTRYFDFYNQRRPHSSLDGRTPDAAYFTQPPLAVAA